MHITLAEIYIHWHWNVVFAD